jgi:chromate transporter
MSVWTLLFGTHSLQWADLGSLFLHFLVLAMFSVGGAIATAPDMHRYVVGERNWITDAEFTASVALAQAAPGPNVLFVAVIGFNVAGLAGVVCTLAGCLIPSVAFSITASRWGHERREARGVRAFSAGLAPITIGLLLASGWVLAVPAAAHWAALALVGLTIVVMLKMKLSPLWLIGAGAAVGAAGWV